MARSVILGNGGLTVGLDENGLVHDFYYPYVGLENLTTARSQPHHIGLWIDGTFSWVHEDKWDRDINFNDDALVSNILMTNENLGIELHFEDFVDSRLDVFARKVRIRNLKSHSREIRIFFHQVFQISALGRADTAMFVPDANYILDYKGRCSILVYAEDEDGVPFDQYAVGNAGIEGKEGTFRDAEDGELSNSAVEHASVDSTIRLSLKLSPHDSSLVHYWLAVADSQSRLDKIHSQLIGNGFNVRLDATIDHWHDWLGICTETLLNLTEDRRSAVKKSLMVIKAHTDEHGGVIASCDSSIYNYGRDYYSYVWPRDGAYAMWPLIKLGYTNEPRKFFEFCRSIIHEDGYLMHKYQPDRAIGSTWHPLVHNNRKELAIQEDETAIVVYMLGEYVTYSNDVHFIETMYDSFIRPAADFMCRFVDVDTELPHASYDLWEEKFLVTTYTTAITVRALLVAAGMARLKGITTDAQRWQSTAEMIHKGADAFFNLEKQIIIKGYLQDDEGLKIDATLDISSFFAAFKFDFFTNSDHLSNTLSAIESSLLNVSPSGGTARYEDDSYFKSEPAYRGNPWFVTTLWMAQYYALSNQVDKANYIIDWTIRNSLHSGLISEQINPENSQVVGVTPLVWSHAELINTILDVHYTQNKII
jgi:GH15 family glucan-1,4-alpha-glucosidase